MRINNIHIKYIDYYIAYIIRYIFLMQILCTYTLSVGFGIRGTYEEKLSTNKIRLRALMHIICSLNSNRSHIYKYTYKHII